MPTGNLWILSNGYVPDSIVLRDFFHEVAYLLDKDKHLWFANMREINEDQVSRDDEIDLIERVVREEFDRRFTVIGRPHE